MNPIPCRRRLVAAACAALATHAHAQTPRAEPADTIVITGNPLRTQPMAPTSVLSGDALVRARAGTLGDTLAGLPGVAGSGFGPQSSRPVIRGLDGDRIRLLDNGASMVDASSLSFDHATAIDPLVIERLEVLRGPAALLYGGNATGGVVNAIDNRMPRSAITGLSGRAELRSGGAASERAGAAVLEGGAGGLNWHADVAGRKSHDLRVPGFLSPETGEQATRVVNSAGDSRAGAMGVSFADDRGFVGMSVDAYRNTYGVTVEPDVTIDMKRDRFSLAADRRLSGPLARIEFHASATRYRHLEIEGSGEVGTTFDSRGRELRATAEQAALPLAGGTLRGAFGAQLERLDFSALGEEAFVPGTATRSNAAFALESWQRGALTLSAGARVERVRIASEGDPAGGQEQRFGSPSTRRFSPFSASLGAQWMLSKSLALTAQLGRTERAPTYYELFANGVHVATGSFELGDTTLAKERSNHTEIGLQWRDGTSSFTFSAFSTRFARYILLDATGNVVALEGEHGGEVASFPEYAFRAVPARLHGLELEARRRFAAGGAWRFDVSAALDAVRGSQRDNGQPLPRLPPLRTRLGIEATHGGWTLGATLRHLARQSRVPAFDVPTAGATLLDLSLGWRQRWGQADVLAFLRVDNVGDELAFNAAALRRARGLSPLAGRSATLGLRVAW